MEEVEALAVDLGQELRVGVDAVLLGRPIEAGAPVAGERTEVADGDAALPVGAGQLVGPAGAGEAGVEVGELVGLDVDGKGLEVDGGGGGGGGGHRDSSRPVVGAEQSV